MTNDSTNVYLVVEEDATNLDNRIINNLIPIAMCSTKEKANGTVNHLNKKISSGITSQRSSSLSVLELPLDKISDFIERGLSLFRITMTRDGVVVEINETVDVPHCSWSSYLGIAEVQMFHSNEYVKDSPYVACIWAEDEEACIIQMRQLVMANL